MVTRLSAAEVGIWYVFLAVQGLAIIADFGFQPTLTRAFAVAFSGGEELQRRGLSFSKATGAPNLRLAAEVLVAARKLYLWLALGMLALLLIAGTPYITWLAAGGNLPILRAQVAWILFAGGVSLNLYMLWISPLLIGSGQVEINYIFLALGRGGFAAVGIIVLVMGGGLIHLSCAMIASIFFSRLAVRFSVIRIVATLGSAVEIAGSCADTLKAIAPNAVRIGVVCIAGFLINRYSLFAISASQGLIVSGAYAITLQLFSALSAVSQMPMQISTKELVSARIENDRVQMRKILISNTTALFVLFIVGALFIQIALPSLLVVIGSNIGLIPQPALGVMAIILLLETHHSGAAFFITTGNEVPFIKPSLLSGVAVVALITLVSWLGFGIMAVIVSQGLVQLVYNNWRWPLQAWNESRA
jgi:hypothetical protein